MLGAIIGDMFSSQYNNRNFSKINLNKQNIILDEDAIFTISIADSILYNKNIEDNFRKFYEENKNINYDFKLKEWLDKENIIPLRLYDYRAAARISSIPFLYSSLNRILDITKEVSIITHNHKEGLKGAEAIVYTIYLAKNRVSKDKIKKIISEKYKYDLNKYKNNNTSLAEIIVPNSLITFLSSEDFEDTLIKSISLKGNVKAVATIACSIAEVYYGLDNIPFFYLNSIKQKIPSKYLDIINEVYYINSYNK